jgi:hypothetical protein
MLDALNSKPKADKVLKFHIYTINDSHIKGSFISFIKYYIRFSQLAMTNKTTFRSKP